MIQDIITISTRIVNCYLLKTDIGFVLIDTGVSFQRGTLQKALNEAGCGTGDIKLVVITHADFDHTGNCAWLRENYGAVIAIHPDEAEAVETGRMFKNRKNKQGILFRFIVNLSGLVIFRRFKPDILVEDGEDLSRYGLNGRIVHIPGHSRGSIGVITGDGDLFCGDLLNSNGEPKKNSLVDDMAEMDASIEKLRALDIKIIYPGHGKPFRMEELS